FALTLDTATTTIQPTVVGTFPTWSVTPGLPSGLSFNTQNGEITGTPDRVTAIDTYTVTATNTSGNVSTTIRL
ncbi:MAG: putative Ig domain-containing protein, partial [Burkholderiaceae bacterium]|nr:putative Ig domain-containing protein [Burkholderiaceae bacterium]